MAAKKRGELLDLIPAYAIDALDENERAEFEAWLQQDLEAQVILKDYQTAADHLLAFVPLHPAPLHLQADLSQRLANQSNRMEPKFQPASRRRKRRYLWLLAAALFAVVILGIVQLKDKASPTLSAAELYAQLDSRPTSTEYKIVQGEVGDQIWGSLLVSSDGDQAVLCIWDLPPITHDQTFQIWLIDTTGARTSAGLFRADPSEAAVYLEVPFDRPIVSYAALGVSLEPAGGSPYADQPTGPRVLSVPLH